MHQTDQDVALTPRVGVGVKVGVIITVINYQRNNNKDKTSAAPEQRSAVFQAVQR